MRCWGHCGGVPGDMVYLLPSFIFILAGGPFIETTHNKVGFTAPLTAITAAVVGVILNLALFFIWHSVWGPSGFDPWSAGIALTAAGLLFRYKWKLTWYWPPPPRWALSSIWRDCPAQDKAGVGLRETSPDAVAGKRPVPVQALAGWGALIYLREAPPRAAIDNIVQLLL